MVDAYCIVAIKTHTSHASTRPHRSQVESGRSLITTGRPDKSELTWVMSPPRPLYVYDLTVFVSNSISLRAGELCRFGEAWEVN